MKLHAHFLAESANFGSDGTFTVFRGGIAEVNAPAWPILLKVSVITRLEFDQREARQLNQLTQRITFEGTGISAEMAHVQQPIAVRIVEDPELASYSNLIGNLQLMVPGPGKITIQTFVNQEALPLLHFMAKPTTLPG